MRCGTFSRHPRREGRGCRAAGSSGPTSVLVKVAYAGICGSDLHVYAQGMFGIVPADDHGSRVQRCRGGRGRGGRAACVPGTTSSATPGWGASAASGACGASTTSARSWPSSERPCPGAMPSSSCSRSVASSRCPRPWTCALAALVEPMAVAVHAMDLAMPRRSPVGRHHRGGSDRPACAHRRATAARSVRPRRRQGREPARTGARSGRRRGHRRRRRGRRALGARRRGGRRQAGRPGGRASGGCGRAASWRWSASTRSPCCSTPPTWS